MATNISEWRSLVSPNSEGAASNTIDKYVVDTIRDFCESTKVWEADLPAMDIVANQAGYALTHATAEVHSVLKARILYSTTSKETLRPVKLEYLNSYERDWDDQVSSQPARYYVDQYRYLYLVYAPSTAITGGLAVKVALKPLLTATTIEDFIYKDYRNAITDGTAAKLLKVAGTKKENLNLSAMFQASYNLVVAQAKIQAERGRSSAPLRGKKTGYI